MSLIKADELTKDKLVELITNAGLEVHDEGENNKIYVRTEAFGLWVSFDSELKRLHLTTFCKCKDNAPLHELGLLSEICNQEYPMIQFSSTVYEDGTGFLNGTYCLYYTFGLVVPNLIHTMKVFNDIFIEAIRVKDKDDKFFS